VTADTLIPRPDTELLVELALQRIPPDAAWTVADLGTGSGAIAAAIALERPRCTLWATDASQAALAVARRNFQRLLPGPPGAAAHLHTAGGDWCAALPAGLRCHLIVSNPPYIPAGDPHLRAGDLPWEPPAALAAGPTAWTPSAASPPRRRAGSTPAAGCCWNTATIRAGGAGDPRRGGFHRPGQPPRCRRPSQGHRRGKRRRFTLRCAQSLLPRPPPCPSS
jgi:hypothetical protein